MERGKDQTIDSAMPMRYEPPDHNRFYLQYDLQLRLPRR